MEARLVPLLRALLGKPVEAGDAIFVPAGDGAKEILVEYFAYPPTIPADAGDEYEFALAEDAAECMPYFVAAQQLLPDLVLDYGGMMRLYQNAVDLLDLSMPGEELRVAQRLFR